MGILEELGFKRILRFEQIPCEVYWHPDSLVTLSLGELSNSIWVKASKHMYIKAMEIKSDSAIYSRLQEITKFMEYLKGNLPEFQCITHYIGDITPNIALKNFKSAAQLQKIMRDYEQSKKDLGDADEEKLMRQLALLKTTQEYDASAQWLESVLVSRKALREKLAKLETELQGATGILNEWVEKGYALALLWTFSTTIHICLKEKLPVTLKEVLEELERIEKLSIRSRAYQQGLWIEDVRDPFYVYHAEALGLFHPKILRAYKEDPIMQSFAEEVEEWFNARLAMPIQRASYKEESSTAIAEAVASFLRQVDVIDTMPGRIRAKFDYSKIKHPIYFGLMSFKTGDRDFEVTDTPFMIDLAELRKHCLITGTIGSGKTRIAQIIAETASLHVPVIIIDPIGEMTGLIRENSDSSKREFKEFRLKEARAYDFAKIYTLDDTGVQFKANLLRKPPTDTEEFIISNADQAALVLSELAGDERLRDIIRETLIDGWHKYGDLKFETFMEIVKEKAERKKTSVKLDRLFQYKLLMSDSKFPVDEILANKLTILTLAAFEHSPTAKIMVTWFILREILNHFLAQPSTEELKALIIVDEVHRFYEPDLPRNAAIMLEATVKQGRSKGLGVVMVSQTIKDLAESLTQANIRILLKILEGEMQMYGQKFGMDLARTLHGLDPKRRIGYVFYSGEEIYVSFRPTLSQPRGLTSFDEIILHTSKDRLIESFNEQTMIEKVEIDMRSNETQPATTQIIDEEAKVVGILKEFKQRGERANRSELQRRLGWGTSKTLRILGQLEAKGILRITELPSVRGHPKAVELI